MNRRIAPAVVAVGLALGVVACPKVPRPLVFGRIEAARTEPTVARAKDASPALWAKAEGLRAKSEEAFARGDTATAELYGDHSIAAYRRAVASARLTAATARKSRETTLLEKAKEKLFADEAARVDIDREADRIETEIAVRREALTPTASGPTDPAREAARWVAARANLATADALCEGAQLLAPKAKGVAEARKVLGELSAKVDGAPEKDKKEAPIDASARVRALCLKALTSARDYVVSGGGSSGDLLLAELSGMGSYEPSRDERGVVATLFQSPAATAPFDGTTAKLTPHGKAKLEALGRVAKTHPAFAVLVVVHSTSNATGIGTRDRDRGKAVKDALVAAGAAPDRVSVRTPGTALPAFDPADAKSKARNERVEVIFVGGAK